MNQNVDAKTSWQIYKRLLRYALPYWHAFCLSVLGFMLYAVGQASLPVVMEYLPSIFAETSDISGTFDFLYKIESPEHLRNALPIFIIILAIARGIGSFFGGYYITVIGQNLINDLRIELFAQIQKLPVDYFTQNGSGSSNMISVLTFNIEQVTSAVTLAVRTLLRESLTIIGLLGFLFYVNWSLTLIFLLVTPVIGLVVATASKFLRRYSTRIQDSMGNVAKVASDNINGLSEVRIYGGQKMEKDRFLAACFSNLIQKLKLATVSELSSPIVQVILFSALSGLFWIGLNTGLRAEMDSGDFLAYITAAAMIARPLRQLTAINTNIQRGIAAAKSVFEVIDAPAEPDDGEISLEKAVGEIEFKNLYFTYPNSSQNILDNFSLKIIPGQTVALVGRSGAGKTTIANLLSRQINVTSGQLLIDNQPISAYKLKDLRSQIGAVSQHVVLFDDSVANNIAYGELNGATEKEISEAIKAAHATDFVECLPLGIHTNIGENGTSLSGGQRQRLALARAFLKDAPILILDEATSALDNESERHVQDALADIMQNRTTIVIAHRLSTIENADMIVVMDDGKIVEQGSHAELIDKAGAYTQLYKMQFRDSEITEE